jgi:hypothetical protein
VIPSSEGNGLQNRKRKLIVGASPTADSGGFMRFFKPEWLRLSQSLDDDVADKAAKGWNHACARYREHLEKIKPFLPQDVAKLKHYLHDAQVVAMFYTKKEKHFNILLKPENEILNYLQFSYLDCSVSIVGHLGFNDSIDKLYVLYDEFDLGYKHNIFMGDGRELKIVAKDIKVKPRKMLC